MVFVSAHSDLVPGEQYLRGRRVPFLKKPFGAGELLAAVGEALGS